MANREPQDSNSEGWPPIPYEPWQDSCATLQLMTQIVGKVRLKLTPWINHSWQVVFYPTARGISTSPIPYRESDFQVDFDFIAHELLIARADGGERRLALRPIAVADFYAEFMKNLRELGIEVKIHPVPNEVENPIPFPQDFEHRSYDPDAVRRFWRALVAAHRVLTEFRSSFLGKVSPVHFFWGSFDLAVTRFSGRTAPLLPKAAGLPLAVAREAYSHEVSSAGFWPGNGGLGYPAFYSYAYPEPEGYSSFLVSPEGTFYNQELGQFLLPYEKVRTAPDPYATLLEFLESTYRAAAELGHWNRKALECSRGHPGVPRPLEAGLTTA